MEETIILGLIAFVALTLAIGKKSAENQKK